MVSKRHRILIVDDTPSNIHVLMEALKDDYAIIVATSGPKALTLAAGPTPPDLILLDVMMEGMDGYEVCRRLKADVRTQSLPVIFVTTLSQTEDEALGLDLGAVDYITKPINPAIVKARVRNHLELKAHRDNLEQLVAEQVQSISSSRLSTIFALSKLAESRDDDTGQHLERTQIYCEMVARRLMEKNAFPDQVDERFIETIYWASPLHDVGKVAVPDQVLCKKGKLTDEEFEVMKSHTLRGSETLRLVTESYPDNDFIKMGLAIARSHHEKWNGTGYPDRLAGDQIPLAARIMAVADVYDALTSKRCYKDAMTHQQATDIIVADSGTHFDPVVVEAFCDIAGEVDTVRARLQEVSLAQAQAQEAS
jgi:putative two-component system response regulator